MIPGGPLTETWHVVFTHSSMKHWLIDRLAPGFGHCYAMKSSRGGQYWAVIDGKRSHLDVQIEPKELFPTVRSFAGDGATIVTVNVTYRPLLPNHWLSVITCTDIVKRCLGITDWHCWTPHQLHKRITGGRYGRYIQHGQERGQEIS